jgi:hypothetical protein
MIMKKYFIFAALVTAGLLTSCSSDDNLAVNDSPVVSTDEGTDLVPIKLNVAQYGTVTRGTGTVGGIVTTGGDAANNDGTTTGTPAANAWQGQKVNVFMFKTFDTRSNSAVNILKVAQFENPEGTLTNIYRDAELTTPKGAATGTASYLTGQTADKDADNVDLTPAGQATRYVKYYPMTDRFDFWGYRIDDAANKALKWMKAGTNGDEDATEGTDATKLKVEFDIDGTQDILAATTTVRTWATTNQANFVDESAYNAAVAARYSASSARKGLDPELSFAHKLTRLTFQGQAGDNESQTVYVRGIRVRPLKEISGTDSTWYSKEDITMTIADITAPTAQPIVFQELQTSATDWNTNKAKTQFVLKKRATGDTDGNMNLVDLVNSADADLTTNGSVSMAGTWTAGTPASTTAVEEASSTNYDNADAENKSEGDNDAMTAYTIPANNGKYFHNTSDSKYYKIVYTAATDPTRTWVPIGESIILPPSEKYEVEILLAQVNTTEETVGGTPVKREKIEYKTLKTVVRNAAGDPPTSPAFEASYTYNFRIIVYGLQRIDIQTTLQPWEFGENVNVDTDE